MNRVSLNDVYAHDSPAEPQARNIMLSFVVSSQTAVLRKTNARIVVQVLIDVNITRLEIAKKLPISLQF